MRALSSIFEIVRSGLRVVDLPYLASVYGGAVQSDRHEEEIRPRSGQHLAVEFLRHQSGAKLVHVPYRGSAPASADVLGGQIPLASIDLTSVQALIQAGRLTPLAVTTARRTELAPDIPTLIEQGIQFSSAAWLGLFAPAGTPEPVIAAISGHVREVLLKPEMKKQVNTHALDVAYEDAASFKAALAKEFAEWTGIVKVLGDVKSSASRARGRRYSG